MEKKEKVINIRITKTDKDKLMKLAQQNNETLSNYILQRSLCTHSTSSETLPQSIHLINFINEIYHNITSYNDNELTEIITSICKSHFSNLEGRL